MHVGALGAEGGDDAVGEGVDEGGAAAGCLVRRALAGHRAGEGVAAGLLGGDGAGDGGDREAGVGEAEAQRVHMPHEPGVDHGDPVPRGHPGEQRLGLGGAGGDPYVEAEGAQVALE